MTRVLSIQSRTMGHKVYADTLNECFRRSGQLQYESLWSQEERSLPTRLITRLASLRVPILSAKERDLDFGRVRIEWSHGRMSRILAARKHRQTPYDVLYFHTQVHALGAEALMRIVPSVGLNGYDGLPGRAGSALSHHGSSKHRNRASRF